MRLFLFITFTFFSLMIISSLFCGCKTRSDNIDDGSHVSQLTAVDYQCIEWPPARIEKIKKIFPNGLLRGWKNDKAFTHALNALAGIPDGYLVWFGKLHKEDNFHISPDNSIPGGISLYPSYINVHNDPEIVDHVLQHEVGHLVQYYVEEISEEFEFPQNFYASADENYDNPQLNAYPKSYGKEQDLYYKEYWAEAFNSYYCSKETHKMVEKHFPSTYAILKRNLLSPVWK